MSDEPKVTSTADQATAKIGEGPDRRGGGTGNAGGTDFHAMAMVVAGVHVMHGTRIGWLENVVSDIPTAIRAETGGPGDDVGLVLDDGSIVEVQAKKNLQRGSELWDALEALIDGIAKGTINYGVLAIAPDSSGTIKDKLAADVIKIGQGETDTLSEIGNDWLGRLQKAGRLPSHCARIRIQTLNLLPSQGADRRTAVDALRSICADPDRAEDALNLMYRDAIALMRSRGRWTLETIVRLLRSQGIALLEDRSPAGTLTKLAKWAETTRGRFSLPAAKDTIPIRAMLPPKLVAIPRSGPQDSDASAALERYHSRAVDSLDNNIFNGEWVGRFIGLNVIVAGPGMGKSTLADRIAWEYAHDGYAVLVAPLKRVAAAMEGGSTFEAAFERHGLDGAGIDGARLNAVKLERLVLIADGLDEAGALHYQVSAGLVAYAAGHPSATIVVTTRPIGYETSRLAKWRHYRLEPPIEKEGPNNLGRLLAASRGLDLVDLGCVKQASRELAATPAHAAIVASPLMIGMAASLLGQSERLPKTLAEMYEAMIALFEGRDAISAVNGLAPLQAKRILDIIGWELTHRPLLTWRQLESVACDVLAADLDRPAIAVAPLFAKGFDYWERAGIVERVHHAGDQLVTFVHKTFGEFAAARFLVSMRKDRRPEMELLVDAPALGEVVSFAGAIGLGNELAEMYVDRRDRGADGQFERALALSADKDAKVDAAKIVELAEIVFSIVQSGAADRFSIGDRLANLAKVKPELVGPIAQALLDDPSVDVKLIAWATAVAAGPTYYDTTRLEQVLREFKDAMRTDEPSGTAGIRANRLGKDIDLIQSIALAALMAQPAAEMVRFIETSLSEKPFTNFGFHNSVQSLLAANGSRKPISPWNRGESSWDMLTLLTPNDAWNRAANRALGALAASFTDSVPIAPDAPVPLPRPYLQFSALYQLAGLGSTEAPDVYKWEACYDELAIAETIRALVAVSPIDRVELAIEASEILARLHAEPGRSAFANDFGNPDVPPPDWKRAASLSFDLGRIEGAFHHGSLWLLTIAANLLANMHSSVSDCERLLQRSRGASLFYAVQIVAGNVDDETWCNLLFKRIADGPSEGTEYIFSALATSGVALPLITGDVVTAALRSESAMLVEAAAKLGRKWLGQGGFVDVDLVKVALRFYTESARTSRGPQRVTAVREELTELLLASGFIDDGLLTEALSDSVSSVQAPAGEIRIAPDETE